MGWGLAVVSLAAATAAAQGVDRFWVGSCCAGPGGQFDSPEHWLDGDTLGVPGPDDTAVFDIPTLYVVRFGGDQSTDRVMVRSGLAIFDLQGTSYTLANPLPTTPSITIGATDVDTAKLWIIAGTLQGQFTNIGLSPGAFGALRVTGATAQLLNDFLLQVGNQGAGLLEISRGALAANLAAFVAAGSGSFGDALVTGTGSLWECAGTLTVGKGGSGGLTIADGGRVISDAAIIAQQASSFGDVVVSGPGSTWTILGTLDVGMIGVGTLGIEGGASVTNEVFATVGTLPADPEFGGLGHVTVSGAGSTWAINGDLYVGFLGAGRWTLSDGGRVIVSGDLFRGLSFQRPRTPQTIIRLGGSNDYPEAAISVTGIADGFDPRVELIDGFLPKVGDTFLIATAGLGVGTFDFELPNLPSPLLWQVQQDTNTVTLHVRRLGDVDGDGTVGRGDLKLLLGAWGPCPDCDNCLADLDGDCAVAVPDLLRLLANWTG